MRALDVFHPPSGRAHCEQKAIGSQTRRGVSLGLAPESFKKDSRWTVRNCLPRLSTWAFYYLLSRSFIAHPHFQRGLEFWLSALPPLRGNESPCGVDTARAVPVLCQVPPLPRSGLTFHVPAQVSRAPKNPARVGSWDTSPVHK